MTFKYKKSVKYQDFYKIYEECSGPGGLKLTEFIAEILGVSDKITAIKPGVPDTLLSSDTFDYVYSTTTLEMIRSQYGEKGYFDALKEIYRILKPGGVFGLGEPMHLENEIHVYENKNLICNVFGGFGCLR